MSYPFLRGVVDKVIALFADWPTVDPSVLTAAQAISVES